MPKHIGDKLSNFRNRQAHLLEAVTQFMVDMVQPQVGEMVLDPACGTGGFLVCALESMKARARDAADLAVVESGIRGIEKKPLPHVLAMTNLFLHGVSVPQIARDNALTRQPYRGISDRDRVDVILTNPLCICWLSR